MLMCASVLLNDAMLPGFITVIVVRPMSLLLKQSNGRDNIRYYNKFQVGL